ncbi:hypothetical protein T4B_1423 [Trichinella pseudospiralis]|uniref:Uncharacterized protein n=1 Tax=Trichinella pseudospiralis TaxID=6337 RepID=A0A0V1J6N0_TRIPS|nr:hypothetical protein T4B_1423 [Trichinella pseudospiralis]
MHSYSCWRERERERRVTMIYPQNYATLFHQKMRLKKLCMSALIHGLVAVMSAHGLSKSHTEMC